ncbi:MAG TPA: 16S rRNA (guanine(966)-N(2))-methyltransferase RsmD [Anaerolineae bacterium]|nr:16S rRNA (guanine(966)-N(2))-methyltransferase RsmD [Anaerolineae bacterium]
MIRVISGKAKGRKLKMVPGDTTRPIMDRAKENLFNILQWDVAGSVWLDLFAGTGQVGIEALSRGAKRVVFIDLARAAIKVVHENLAHTDLAAGATVLQSNALGYLSKRAPMLFDFIYVAPPQYKGIWVEVMAALDGQVEEWLTAEGQVIVQIAPKEWREREKLDLKNLEVVDERKYGRTMFVFYARVGGEEE